MKFEYLIQSFRSYVGIRDMRRIESIFVLGEYGFDATDVCFDDVEIDGRFV